MEALLLDGCRHPDEVGLLFEAYTRDLLRQAPDFAGYLAQQDYSHELSHLEEKYGRPHGRLYLLRCDGAPAGTVALRRIDESCCELKRLYVHPDFRGHGYARRLAETVLTDAAAIGYRQVLLDTFPFLTGAIALYRDLGFREIPSYNGSPMPELIYMALELPSGSHAGSGK